MDEIIDLGLNVIASDGEIPKCWDEHREYLYKAPSISINGGYGIESEWLSSHIAKLLGIETVIYDIIERKVRIYDNLQTSLLTRCNTFLKGKYIILDTPAKIYTSGNMEKFLLKYFQSDLQKLNNILVLDYIIINQDRHLNNMGYMIDIEGNKKMAPSYDYDKTLYSHITDDNYRYFYEDDPYVAGKPFGNHLRNNLSFVRNNGCGITMDLSVADADIFDIVFKTPGNLSKLRKTNIANMIVRRYNYVKSLDL